MRVQSTHTHTCTHTCRSLHTHTHTHTHTHLHLHRHCSVDVNSWCVVSFLLLDGNLTRTQALSSHPSADLRLELGAIFPRRLVAALKRRLETQFPPITVDVTTPPDGDAAGGAAQAHMDHLFYKDFNYFVEYTPLMVVYVFAFLYLYFSVREYA